ncbi:MAG: HEPN domain-containing protein [Bacteroidales bacterium]
MSEKLNELVKYRIQQAYETIAEVEFQIANNYLNTAVTRIYYGMFYILLALALKNNFKTSKHQQLIGWFNKEFVKSGKVDTRLGSIIHKAYEDRTDSDYGIFIEFEKAEVQIKLEEMNEFISKIDKLIID